VPVAVLRADLAATQVLVADARHDGPAGIDRGEGRVSVVVFTRGSDPWRLVAKVLREAGELRISIVHSARPGQWANNRRRPGFAAIRD
jgi:hypothetical protein